MPYLSNTVSNPVSILTSAFQDPEGCRGAVSALQDPHKILAIPYKVVWGLVFGGVTFFFWFDLGLGLFLDGLFAEGVLVGKDCLAPWMEISLMGWNNLSNTGQSEAERSARFPRILASVRRAVGVSVQGSVLGAVRDKESQH